jgi:hypothetical protein
LCREIDLLHPQVDDGGRRPDNVEYPWPALAPTKIPALWKFPVSQKLQTAPGRLLLKVAANLTRRGNGIIR